MFKPKLVLEVKGTEDRFYKFECDPKAPLGEIHDSLYTMKCVIVKMINEHNEKEAPKKEECVEGCKTEEEKE